MEQVSTHTHHHGDFTWDGVPVLNYKEDGLHFRDITRQVLYAGAPELPCQLRYFEIAPDGYSTLERHQHHHVVMILRGAGTALIADRVLPLAVHDVLHIAAGAWHQFRADHEMPLGFLCLVPIDRDRPERPRAEDLERLRQHPEIAAFIRV